MNFADFIERACYMLDITNDDVCSLLGIGTVSLENYISGYSKPPAMLVAKALKLFPQAVTVSEPEALSQGNDIPIDELRLSFMGKGLICFKIGDDDLAGRRVFAGDYAVLKPCSFPEDRGIFLASADGDPARLYQLVKVDNGWQLETDHKKIAFTEDDFNSKVQLLAQLCSTACPESERRA